MRRYSVLTLAYDTWVFETQALFVVEFYVPKRKGSESVAILVGK